MAENLRYDTGSESWAYSDDPSFIETYGRLYSWKTAEEACPEGWRLPAHNELNLLVENMGGNEVAGEALKSENHLSLLLGGFRFPDGKYDAIEHQGVYWSGTEMPDNNDPHLTAWILAVFSNDNSVDETRVNKAYGFSVRCLQN